MDGGPQPVPDETSHSETDSDREQYELIGRLIVAGAWIESELRDLTAILMESPAGHTVVAGRGVGELIDICRVIVRHHREEAERYAQLASISGRTPRPFPKTQSEIDDLRELDRFLERTVRRQMEQRNNVAHGTIATTNYDESRFFVGSRRGKGYPHFSPGAELHAMQQLLAEMESSVVRLGRYADRWSPEARY